MKRSVGWTILCAVLVLSAAATTGQTGPGEKGQQPPASLSNTRQASCLLKITWDPETLPLDEQYLHMLVYSSGVAGHAAWKVFGERMWFGGSFSTDDATSDVSISFFPMQAETDRGMAMAALEVSIPPQAVALQPAAEEFLAATCRRLRSVLIEAHRSDLRRVHEQQEQVRKEQAEAEQQLVRLQELRRTLCVQAGRNDLSREAILEQIQDLERDKQHLELELAGHEAQRGALEEQIAVISQRLETATDDDTVVAELEKVVKLRAEQLGRMHELVAKGLGTSTDMVEAQEPLAMAKVELAEQRRAAMERLGAGRVAELNEELARISIHAAEAAARLRFISQQLEQGRAKKLLELADHFEREVAVQLPLARAAVEFATQWRAELQRQVRMTSEP
ncbi:MAG: hypothetical protein ACYS7M_01130, partial [Planctomycetota bacterium]